MYVPMFISSVPRVSRVTGSILGGEKKKEKIGEKNAKEREMRKMRKIKVIPRHEQCDYRIEKK